MAFSDLIIFQLYHLSRSHFLSVRPDEIESGRPENKSLWMLRMTGWSCHGAQLTITLWGILDFKFAPAKNTPPNPAIFSADFGSDMQNKLPGCIFFYVPWCPGSLGPPGHVFRKKLLCRQWKLQIHRDWVWLCMAADFLLIHEKSAAESGFLGCAAKPLAF